MKQEPQNFLRVPLGTHRTSTVQSVTSHRVVNRRFQGSYCLYIQGQAVGAK